MKRSSLDTLFAFNTKSNELFHHLSEINPLEWVTGARLVSQTAVKLRFTCNSFLTAVDVVVVGGNDTKHVVMKAIHCG